MAIEKFIPTSPDLDIRQDSDLAPAKFGHLNRLVDDINAGGLGGGLYQEGEGLNSSVRCGDLGNVASGEGSFIANGTNNTASGCGSVVLNGNANIALGVFSLVHGSGNCATINAVDSVVLGGNANKAFGRNSTIFGARNTVCAKGTQYHSTIAGGADNLIDGALGFVGGGIGNQILGHIGSSCNTIVGGEQNCIISCYSSPNGTNFIGAGRYNGIVASNTICVNSVHSTIAGGCHNRICGYNYGTIPGGAYNCITNGAALSRQEGGVISGGVFNLVGVTHGSITGSFRSTVTGCSSTISGGFCNTISGQFSSIQAGRNNTVSSAYSSIFGGEGNVACHSHAGIFGCDITSRMDCAFHTNRIVVTALPSSATGLPIGALWYDPADGNRVKFVSA
jgi:hypothetical protein